MIHIKKIICLSLALCLVLMLGVPAMAAEPVQGKYLALTFDDGPNPNFTPWILDELASRNVKCTFFLLGDYARAYPYLAKRTYDEGHQLASHTFSHRYLPEISDQGIRLEIEETRAVLESITGESEFMVRVPYGGYTDRVLGLIDAPVILWSVDGTNGSSSYNADTLYYNMCRQVHDGAIVLLHDTSSANINAALRFIDTMRAEGYTFVTVDELFRIRGAKAYDHAVYHRLKDTQTWYDEAELSSHWAWESISAAGELGLMKGDGTGFKPNEHMTRAMAVTLLWRACGEKQVKSAPGFQDVAEDSWYYSAVAWGVDKGIIKGIDEFSFAPDDYISREQLIALVMRLAESEKIKLPAVEKQRSYCDEGLISEWARSSITALWQAGFVSANDMSAFRPKDGATRAEAAELLVWYNSISE